MQKPQEDIIASPLVFVAYAEEDQTFCDELKKYLKPLQRTSIFLWSVDQISPGKDVWYEVHRHLDAASLVLLLLSPDFLASDAWHAVMLRAVELSGVGKVAPIIIRSCNWEDSPIGGLRVLPQGGRPVDDWKSHDVAWRTVTQDLYASLGLTTRSVVSRVPRLARRSICLALVGIVLQCLFAYLPFSPPTMSFIAENTMNSASSGWLPLIVVMTLLVLGLFESVPLLCTFWLGPIVGAIAGSVGVFLGAVVVHIAITHYYSPGVADTALPLSPVLGLLCLWNGISVLVTGLVAKRLNAQRVTRPRSVAITTLVYLIMTGIGCFSFSLLRSEVLLSNVYPLIVISTLTAVIPELPAFYIYVLLSIFPGLILFGLSLLAHRTMRNVYAALIRSIGKRALYVCLGVLLALLVVFGLIANEGTSNQLQGQNFPVSVPVTTSCDGCLPLYLMVDVSNISSDSNETSTWNITLTHDATTCLTTLLTPQSITLVDAFSNVYAPVSFPSKRTDTLNGEAPLHLPLQFRIVPRFGQHLRLTVALKSTESTECTSKDRGDFSRDVRGSTLLLFS